MQIIQSSLIGVAISLILSFPAKASFPCQDFYSVQPELTLDQLLDKAEFVGMYMAKSATRTERRIDGGSDNFYEYEMLPLRRLLTTRSIRAWLPRWREFLVYAHVAFNLVMRRGFDMSRHLPPSGIKSIDER